VCYVLVCSLGPGLGSPENSAFSKFPLAPKTAHCMTQAQQLQTRLILQNQSNDAPVSYSYITHGRTDPLLFFCPPLYNVVQPSLPFDLEKNIAILSNMSAQPAGCITPRTPHPSFLTPFRPCSQHPAICVPQALSSCIRGASTARYGVGRGIPLNNPPRRSPSHSAVGVSCRSLETSTCS
jgi:hypothetical protein